MDELLDQYKRLAKEAYKDLDEALTNWQMSNDGLDDEVADDGDVNLDNGVADDTAPVVIGVINAIYKHSEKLRYIGVGDAVWNIYVTSLERHQPFVANLLLRLDGLSVDTVSPRYAYGQTLLHIAARTSLAMTKRLIEKGAEVNAVNKTNETPLHEAARKGTLATIKHLVESGAKINAVESLKNRTPLHVHVAKKHPKLEVVEWLKEHGADIQATDSKGRTAAQLARVKGHGEIARYLDPTLETQLDSRHLSFSSPQATGPSSVETTSPSPSSPPKRDITP